MGKLTDTAIKAAKPKEKEYNLTDGAGLTLRVKPSGKKHWLLNYTKPHTSSRSNIGLGHYPAITLQQARKLCGEYRALIAQGTDPKFHKEQTKLKAQTAHANTLAAITAEWHRLKLTRIRQDTADRDYNRLKRHILPTLGRTPIDQLEAIAAIACLQPLAAAGKLDTLNRMCQYLNEIMALAVNSGLTHHNPLTGIRKAFPTHTQTNNPTLRPEQLPDFMSRLAWADNITRPTRCLIEWQLHTMSRPKEAAHARWEEIDLTAGTWTIPAERMKRAKEHIVPLTPQTLALLEILRPITGHLEHLFAGTRNQHKPMSSQCANAALKRMGLAGQLTSHGLRALASTTLNEQAFDADIIESALSHIDKNEVRRAYNRTDYLERRKVMMCWWSEHIENAAIGNMSLTGKRGLELVTETQA